MLPLLLGWLATAPPAAGEVEGVVRDAAGAAVAGARVTFHAGGTDSATFTGPDGRFSIPGRAAAGWVAVEAAGFAPFRRNVDPLRPGASTLTIVLRRAFAEEVTVAAARVPEPLAETPASVVVLGSRALELTPALAVDDVLRQVPGFTLFRRSGSRAANPTTQGASLRGLGGSGASRALVLDDGVFATDGYVLVAPGERGAVDTAASSRHGGFELAVERAPDASSRQFAALSAFHESRDNGTPLQTNDTRLRQVVVGADRTGNGARGLEADAEARLGDAFTATASWLFVDSTVVASDPPALVGLRPQVPRHQGSLSLRYAHPALRAALQVRFAGRQFDDDVNLFPLGEATSIDVLAARPLGRDAELYVAAENLLDTRYDVGRTPVRTLGPPRSVRAGIRLHVSARP